MTVRLALVAEVALWVAWHLVVPGVALGWLLLRRRTGKWPEGLASWWARHEWNARHGRGQ